MRGTDTLWVATMLSIGHGTVFLYCKRISKAIRRVQNRFAGWPTVERKEAISSKIEEASGFPKCPGSADGGLIRFTEEPGCT